MKGKMNGKMKGQAAMEYLMTYGWALLVIVIVLGALLFINPFKTPEQCTFDTPTLACGKPLLTADGDGKPTTLYTTLTNGFSSQILVCGVRCTSAKEVPASPSTTCTSRVNANGEADVLVQCEKDNAGTISEGEDFTGKLYLYYKLSDDSPSFPQRQAVATVGVKAQKAAARTLALGVHPSGSTNSTGGSGGTPTSCAPGSAVPSGGCLCGSVTCASGYCCPGNVCQATSCTTEGGESGGSSGAS